MNNKKTMKKFNIFLNISIIFAILGINNLSQFFIFFNSEYKFIYLIIGLIILICDVIYIKKYLKKYDINKIELNDKKVFDKWSIILLNSLFILFIQVVYFIFSSISIIFNSKISEILELYNMKLSAIQLLIFFILKYYIKLKIIYRNNEKIHFLKNELKLVFILNVGYMILSGLIYYFFEKYFVLSPVSLFVSILSLITIIYNFTRMNKITYYKRKPNKIVVSIIGILLLLIGGYNYLSKDIWLVQPYINSVSYLNESNSRISYNEDNGIYTITMDKDEFKILQLTDIHLGGSAISYEKDLKALKTVYSLIEETKPDFVIVTGDLTYPVGLFSFSFNNTAPVGQFAAFMRNIGIPWAFVYGNHDTESYAATDKSKLDELYKSLSYKTSKNLLYPYIQPNITGRNNQVIELRNNDGTLNQALFLMDSNSYTGDGFNKYDYIHDDQVDWYKENIERLNNEENKVVSSLVFFHMPLQEYETAYNLYLEKSEDVKYYFGSNDEKMFDKICDSEYPSKLFDTAVELKSTKGMFCGHDHYNNMSLEYKGVRLTYGMSIDYLAMPGIARDTKQRGATLITTYSDSNIIIEQVPYSN